METLHYLLMKSHSVMQRKIYSEAQKLGLTSGQPKILDYLYEHEGSDQKTIAGYCEIEPATLGSILLRMEQKGLIERRQKNGNRRSLYVYLTDSGKEICEKMHDIFSQADEQAVNGISPEKVQEVKNILTEICRNLDGKE
ncbi:MAG: MarR family transcriptional regulator [Ruminococcus sp.]|nr:MarR family transcriptional regulator [Ruminococcus sp.]MDE6796814.1 MarR family transcriptional regulator [Ruminococcus sp.]